MRCRLLPSAAEPSTPASCLASAPKNAQMVFRESASLSRTSITHAEDQQQRNDSGTAPASSAPPWGTGQQRTALQRARAGLLGYDRRAPLFIVFPHMRPYALNLSSSLTAALQSSPTNHDLLPRGTNRTISSHLLAQLAAPALPFWPSLARHEP